MASLSRLVAVYFPKAVAVPKSILSPLAISVMVTYLLAVLSVVVDAANLNLSLPAPPLISNFLLAVRAAVVIVSSPAPRFTVISWVCVVVPLKVTSSSPAPVSTVFSLVFAA